MKRWADVRRYLELAAEAELRAIDPRTAQCDRAGWLERAHELRRYAYHLTA